MTTYAGQHEAVSLLISDAGLLVERTLRLRRDAPLSEQSGAVDALQIATPRGTVILPGLALGVREAVRCLAREETTEERLAALVTDVDGESGLLACIWRCGGWTARGSSSTASERAAGW